MKKFKYLAGLSDDRGQAAIEYVLLLIVSVSLVLALVYQIFQPMQKYMQAYMGDYVQCLLETGGLPSFGGDVTSAKDMGCTIAQFQNVDGKNGSSGSSSGANGSKSDSNGDGSGSSSSSSSSGGSDSSSGSSSSSRYAGSNSRNGGRNIRSPRKGNLGVESGQQGGGRVVEIALDGNGSGSFFGGGRGNNYVLVQKRKVSAVNMSGWTEAERKKVEKKDDTGHTKVIATDDNGPAPKKISVKKPERNVAVAEEEKPLTVGNFIRYLFIAALIIALVIFIGGQALSMSKGDGEN